MGRLTQYFDYINRKETPTARDIQFEFNHLTITQDIRDARFKHRLEVNKREKAINAKRER